MAGMIDIPQRGLPAQPRGEVLRFDPALDAVKRLGYSVHYRDHRIDVDVTHDSLRVGSRPGTGWPITILVRAAEAGATIFPACPGFYHRPQDLTELARQFAGRVLDHLGLDHNLTRRWGE
jgi:hypothetical protein